MFRVVAIADSEEVASKYIESDEISRRDILKKLQSLTTVHHDAATLNVMKERHAEVYEKVRSEGIQRISSKRYAEWANLPDYYNTAYAYFSQAAHADVRELEDLIEKDADDEPVAIRYGPDQEDVVTVLDTASEAVVKSLAAAYKLLEGGSPVGLRVIQRKLANHLSAPAGETSLKKLPEGGRPS
jgi:hypothetical protein